MRRPHLDFFCASAITLALCFVVGTAATSYADPNNEDLSPPRLPALPDTIELLGEGKIINSFNAPQFKALIPLELYPLIKGKKLELDARQKLRFDLSAQSSLKADGKETSETTISTSSAEELLRFVAEHALSPYYEGNFRSAVLRDQQVKQEYSGDYYRLYPQLLKLEKGAAQLFRERLVLRDPPFLSGYTLLLFRFKDEIEDLFYAYSPIIGKTRQLTASLRSDALFRSLLSVDDIFTWSGNPLAVQASSFSETMMLVPFISAEVSPATTQREKCVVINPQNVEESSNATSTSSHFGRWNFESKRFPQAGGAILSQGVFVPRSVYRLELEPRDPYALYGRQLLYIDKETHLIVYKSVLDRKGQPWKFVWSALGGYTTDPKMPAKAYVAATVVEELQSKESQIFDFESVRLCSVLPSSVSLTDFDPRKLGPKQLPSVTPTPTSGKEFEAVDEDELPVEKKVEVVPPLEDN